MKPEIKATINFRMKPRLLWVIPRMWIIIVVAAVAYFLPRWRWVQRVGSNMIAKQYNCEVG